MKNKVDTLNSFANINPVNNIWRINMNDFFCHGCMTHVHSKHKSETVSKTGKPVCNMCEEKVTSKRQLAEVQRQAEMQGEQLTHKSGKATKPRLWREIEAKKEELALSRISNDYGII
jgi:hypothetical protein